jgi:quercetin dioxygenase-like cupin family protein
MREEVLSGEEIIPSGPRRQPAGRAPPGCYNSASAGPQADAVPSKGAVVNPPPVSLYRWDEIALDKVTEMISRKIVTGAREMLAQVYLKKGALVPMHAHESEQMTYVLQGALKFLIGGEEITVREGEVLHIPSGVEHQAEALDDTFELDVYSPIRQDWLDHTDTYWTK